MQPVAKSKESAQQRSDRLLESMINQIRRTHEQARQAGVYGELVVTAPYEGGKITRTEVGLIVKTK